VVPPSAAQKKRLAGTGFFLEPDTRFWRNIWLRPDEIAPFAQLAKILYDADIVLLRGARDESRKE
jgi:hypothetical protein